MNTIRIALPFLFIGFIWTLNSCSPIYFRSNYNDTNSLLHGTTDSKGLPFLKAHLKNGEVVILRDTWKVDSETSSVVGNGLRYDFNRKLLEQGNMTIPVSSVALFETNQLPSKPESGRITALTVLAGVDAVIGIICATNPKACFGSCPTFYLDGDENIHHSNAEGFSNAILPSMEYGDFDALGKMTVEEGKFSITMKNEALETHNIREISILGAPVSEGQRVYQTPDNQFYRCGVEIKPKAAMADEGDVSALMNTADRQERFSLADAKNLHSKEEILLTFDGKDGIKDLGLLLHFRQTLLTTYLFYNAMGYMGNEVGDLFARLETELDLRKRFDATTRMLGGIEVWVMDNRSGTWVSHGSFFETGPIAINQQMISIGKQQAGEVHVKLVFNRGLWRLDYASLVPVLEKISPQEFRPVSVSVAGAAQPKLLDDLFSTERHLISLPGSEFRFDFQLPDAEQEWDMFLYSKGYYLEWMRQHWLADKNLPKLRQMVNRPARYLRREAGAFKEHESVMETQFWNSRIDTRSFTYENH